MAVKLAITAEAKDTTSSGAAASLEEEVSGGSQKSRHLGPLMGKVMDNPLDSFFFYTIIFGENGGTAINGFMVAEASWWR